jgi:Zn-dependent proteases
MLHFNILNMKIELHITYFLLLCLVVLSGNEYFGAASVLFSFLHELVHKKIAEVFGYTPEKISLGLFGGVLHLREGFIQPQKELLIHLSGPLFNIVIATILYIPYVTFLLSWLEPVILANLVLGLFNLMPFYPLDGGKIIFLYLAFFLGYSRSEKISRFFSRFFSLFLFLFGIYLVQYNVFNIFLCLLALNLFVACKQDNSFIFYKVTRNMEESEKKIHKKMVVCRENAKAIKIIGRYKPLETNTFTIVNEKGNYKGQLSETELLNGIYHCGIYADLSKILDYKRR